MNRMQTSSFSTVGGITFSLLLFFTTALPVNAQGILEEIVVTAQKREQRVQDVAMSITAFSGDQVREMGFTNTTDIVAMTPGFNYTVPNGEGSQINFFLRGVGLNDFQDVNENPVGAYFDDVYRGAMGGLSMQLFDMERVEVLRGPQGTLYGRNTTGGLVHFVSKKPTEELEGYAQVSGGSYSQIKFEGAIGGAISESLLGRLSVATNNDSGYTKNLVDGIGDFNETDSVAVRGQLLWQSRDDMEVLTKLHFSNNKAQVGAWQHQASIPTENGDNRRNIGPDEDLFGEGPGTDVFGYRDTSGDPHVGEYDRDGKLKVAAHGASVNFTWRLNETLTLVSISAFDHTDRLQEEDTDAGPFPLIMPTFGADTDQWTQEIRLHGDFGQTRWILGAYYFNQEVIGKYLLDATNLGFVFFDADIDQNTESWSVFGQFEYDLNAQWSVSAGLRFTQEDKTLNYESVDTTGLFDFLTEIGVAPPVTPTRPTPDHAFLFNRQTVGSTARHDKTNVTGRFEVNYRPNDDMMLYASFSRGVKSAGFNTGFLDETLIFASNTVDTIPFDEETLHAVEAGFKSEYMGGRVRLNGSAFYYDYKDFQTFRFELLNAIIFNTDAEVYGGELELQLNRIWEGWDFMFGLAALSATAKDIPSFGTDTLRNRDMVAAPDFTLNGLARYEWPLFNGMGAVLAKFQYQTETFFDIQNYDNARQGDYFVADLRLQWTSGDGHWQGAFFIDNITDKKYKIYTFDFAPDFGFNQEAYGKPRWFGGSVSYRF